MFINDILNYENYCVIKNHHLDTPLNYILNKTSMINIDAKDIKSVINDHFLCAYISQEYQKGDELELVKLDDGAKYGILFVEGGATLSLKTVNALISAINKSLNSEISVIYGMSSDREEAGLRIIGVFTK